MHQSGLTPCVTLLLLFIELHVCKSNYLSLHTVYSGTSDKGPSEIGTATLQRTLVAAPC